MGLDMYLRANLFVCGYPHSEERATYDAIIDASGLRAVASPDTPHADLKVMVAYWRKANAIHRWFVDNVQKGVDDCDEYYVTREKLTELRDTCQRVLDVAQIAGGQPVHAGTTWYSSGEQEEHFEIGRAILNGAEVAKILPSAGGFFFGSLDYDEWYLQKIEGTIAQLDRVLKHVPEDTYLYYQSSW
jgi:hypothetical protein